MSVYEAHFLRYDTGHILHRHDCWCEPRIVWYMDAFSGGRIMAIYHTDALDPLSMKPVHRLRVLYRRIHHPDWVTTTLETLDPHAPAETPAPSETDDDEDETIVFEADFDLEEFLDDDEREQKEE